MGLGQQNAQFLDLPDASTHRVDGTAVDPELVRRECGQILSHPLFSNSKRYSGLLRYVVEHTLDGRHDCLKERIIGIEVFGRPTDYNTNEDATVRVAVKEVRKRLASYFDDPSHQNELRIDLPTGTYVAVFTPPYRQMEPPRLQIEQPTPSLAPSLKMRSLRSLYIAIPIAAVLLLAAFWGATRFHASTPAVDAFWAPMLKYQGPVSIVLARPERNTPRPEGTVPSGPPENSLAAFIARQPNFPVSELSAANSIGSFMANKGRQSAVRLASSTTLSELRGAPVIVLGSYTNAWAIRLGSELHYRFQQDSSHRLHWIEDTTNPRNRSGVINFNVPVEQVTSEYALITRAIDATTGQWWIGIGGTSVLGTLGAQQMLMDPSAMSALSAQLPKGWQSKNLQIVVEFKMVDGSLGASRVVDTYLW